MKFLIERTTDIFCRNKPTENAVIAKSKSEFKCYEIEINSLEELISLVKNEGDVIVKPNYSYKREFPRHKYMLEIYDGFRE